MERKENKTRLDIRDMTLKLTIYEQHTSTHTKETGKYLNRG
jgi:hypothetical protein